MTDAKYKGELFDVSSLINTNTQTPVWIESGTVPPLRDKNGNVLVEEQRINKLIVVTNVVDHNTYILVNYYKYFNFDGRVRSFSVNRDHKLYRMTGGQAAKMLKVVTDFQYENLDKNIQGTRFLSGSDPEIFVEKNKTIIPAFDFMGTKDEPKHKAQQYHGAAPVKVYADGFAVEFETVPLQCLAYHIDSIQSGLKTAYDAAKSYDKKATLTLRNTMMIPSEIMAKASDEDIAYGCMPSLNVYGMKGRVVAPRDLPFRFAGGHIHFGCGKQSPEKITNGMKALDAILGVACVSLFAKIDSSMRREYYGMAGEYRLPPHGLEYRVLSNAWLCHPLITNLVYDLARRVLNLGFVGLNHVWNATEEEVIATINNHDVAKAREILLRNETVFLKILKAAHPGTYDVKILFDTWMNGVEYAIKDPNDIVGNWHLAGKWVTHCGNVGNSLSSAYSTLAKKGKV